MGYVTPKYDFGHILKPKLDELVAGL